MKNKLSQAMFQGYYKQIADKLAQHIQYIQQSSPQQKNRWIWELLQNAKDTPNKKGQLYIKIQLYENELKFMHNGDPFEAKDLVGLIQQVSSKQIQDKNKKQNIINQNDEEYLNEQEKIGKFGTGFITTHMISKIINIEGMFTDDNNQIKKFQILLDRNFNNIGQLVNKVKQNMKNLTELSNNLHSLNSIPNYKYNEKIDTIFTYRNLDIAAIKIIQIGLKSLVSNAIYIFLFNKKIKFLQIKNFRKNYFIKIQYHQKKIINQIWIYTIKITYNQNKNQTITYQSCAYIQKDHIQSIIAIPVRVNQQKIEIKEISSNIPNLYQSFPFVGTQNWKYNFVVSSKKFICNQRRTGLRLNIIEGRKNEKVNKNREVLRQIFNQLKQFIKKLKMASDKGIEFMLKSDFPKQNNQLIEFYKNELYLDYRKFMMQEKIIKLNNIYYSLPEIELIYIENNEKKLDINLSCQVYEYDSCLKNDSLYKKQVNINLINLMNNNCNDWKFKKKNITNFINQIQKLNLQQLKQKFNTQNQLFQFLNKFYQFLNYNFKQQFHKAKIIMTQSGNFNLLANLKQQTIQIQQPFRKIMKSLNSPIQPILIHPQINNIYNIQPYNKILIFKKIKQLLYIQNVDKHLKNKQLQILFQFIYILKKQHTINIKSIQKKKQQKDSQNLDQLRYQICKLCSKIKIFKNCSRQLIQKGNNLSYLPFINKFLSQTNMYINQHFSKDIPTTNQKLLQTPAQNFLQFLTSYQKLLNKFQPSIKLNKILNYENNFIDNTEKVIYFEGIHQKQIQLYQAYVNPIRSKLLNKFVDKNIFMNVNYDIRDSKQFLMPIIKGFQELSSNIRNKQKQKCNKIHLFIQYFNQIMDQDNNYKNIEVKRNLLQPVKQYILQTYIAFSNKLPQQKYQIYINVIQKFSRRNKKKIQINNSQKLY